MPPLWLQGCRETLIRHLKSCPHQPDKVRAHALAEAESKAYIGGGISPQPTQTLSSIHLTPILSFPSLTYDMAPPSLPQLSSVVGSLSAGPSHIASSVRYSPYQYSVSIPSPFSSASSPLQLSPLSLDLPQMSPATTPCALHRLSMLITHIIIMLVLQNSSILQFPSGMS